MKKFELYENPDMMVIQLEYKDVVRTSGEGIKGDGTGGDTIDADKMWP